MAAMPPDIAPRKHAAFTTAWSLPQELTDQIVDHLSDDKRTLRICALICRMFVRRSREHLFHEIALSHSPFDVNFLDVFSNSQVALHSVRKLHIECKRSQHFFQLSKQELLIFPSLRHLLLESIQFNEAPDTFLAILSAFTYRTLTLHDSTFGSHEDLCRSVRGFKETGHLEIIECKTTTSYTKSTCYTCTHEHAPLRSITLVQSEPRLYHSLLQCRGTFTHLTSASVYLGVGHDFALLSAVLVDTKDTLQDLHIHLSRRICNNQWIVTVNLTVALPISHLRKFSIHIWGTGLVAAPVVRWLLGSLVACPTPHRLKAVEFVVDLSTDEMQSDTVHDYALWKTVSAALSLEQFKTLQTLRVVVCLRSHPQFRWRTPLTKNDLLPVKEEIEKQFETFSGQREILSFEVDTTDAIPKYE